MAADTKVERVSETDMPGSSIAHFTLATRDVDATSKFFQATLFWKPIARPNNIGIPAAWLRIAPNQELHLIEVIDFESSRFEREFGRHFAINYAHDQFPALRARLTDHGAELVSPERPTPFERFFSRSQWISIRSYRGRPRTGGLNDG